MKIEGQHTFDAPRDVVWDAVLDADVLAKILPGCEDFKQIDDHTFEGILKIKVGPVQGKFKGKVELSDLVKPESYHLSIKGKGAPGFVDGQGTLRLEADGARTRVHYDIDTKIGGRIATVGQRLIDSSAKVITRQSLEGLEAQLAARQAAAEQEAIAAAAEQEAEAAEAAAKDSKPTPAVKKASAPKTAGVAYHQDGVDGDAEREKAAGSARATAEQARRRADAARHAAASMEPPSTASFALRFAGDLLAELVPEEHRKTAKTAGLVGLVVIVALFLKSCCKSCYENR